MPSLQKSKSIRLGLSYQGIPLWRHSKFLKWFIQIVSGILVLVLVSWFFLNIATAIAERNIPYGFDFLERAYQTPIGHHFLPYDSSNTFLYALFVGGVNTSVISIVGVLLATILGIFIGVCRLSKNWLISKTSLVYIEIFRNVPLLILLFFWFYIMLTLPEIKESFTIADKVYISNSGVSFPWFSALGFGAGMLSLILVLATFALLFFAYKFFSSISKKKGKNYHPLIYSLILSLSFFLAGWFILYFLFGQHPLSISVPYPQGTFGRISGGFTVPAGLIALLIGLVLYASSFIAEIVRAGIQSVNKGQVEAARALGLSKFEALRHITFPQSLRVIVPPTISEYLNLTKNSSLAAIVGYPDLVNVAKTMTQTAPAISIFILIMAAYLVISLTYSLIGNIYNRHIKFTGG